MFSCILANLMLTSASSDVIGGVCYVQHKHGVMCLGCYNIRSSKNSISCSCFFIGHCSVSAQFQHYIFFILVSSKNIYSYSSCSQYVSIYQFEKKLLRFKDSVKTRSWTEVRAFKTAMCSFNSKWQQKLTITQCVQCVCSVCVSALWPDSSQQL